MKTIKQRLEQLQADYLNEIEKGNFEISNVIQMNENSYTINVIACDMSIRTGVFLDTKRMYHSALSEHSFISGCECPEIILNKLNELPSEIIKSEREQFN